MKKHSAIMLLVIGSVTVIFGLAWANLFIVDMFMKLGIDLVGVILAILIAAAAAFGLDSLRRLFKRCRGLTALKFFLCVYLPPAVVSVALWIYAVTRDFSELGGVYELLIALFCSVTTVVMFGFGLIWLAIFAVIERKKSNEREWT